MDQQSLVVMPIVGVPANVGSLVDDQHALSQLAGEPFRDDAAGEAGAHHEGVEAVAGGRRGGAMKVPVLCFH